MTKIFPSLYQDKIRAKLVDEGFDKIIFYLYPTEISVTAHYIGISKSWRTPFLVWAIVISLATLIIGFGVSIMFQSASKFVSKIIPDPNDPASASSYIPIIIIGLISAGILYAILRFNT